MEQRHGLFSRFTGLFKIIVSILLVFIIALFVVIWVRSHNASKRAEKATKVVATKTDNTDTSNTSNQKDASKSSSTSDSKAAPASPPIQIPSGVADSSNGDLPSTGVNGSVLLTAVSLSAVTYGGFAYNESRKRVAHLR